MARFKRWTRGVVSSIDEFVVQIENHEAQVASALRELEHAVARAKVQLQRVERDGKALEQSVTDEHEAVVRWRERALREPQEARAPRMLAPAQARPGTREGARSAPERTPARRTAAPA